MKQNIWIILVFIGFGCIISSVATYYMTSREFEINQLKYIIRQDSLEIEKLKKAIPPVVKYSNDLSSFEKWMMTQGLKGKPVSAEIGGFNLNAVNFQLKSDSSGFE